MAYRRRYYNSSRSYEQRGDVKATYIPSVEAYKVSFPFNQQLVDAIKSTVPSSERSYDPETKEWTIATKYFDVLLPVMKIIFSGSKFHVVDKAKVEEFNQGMAQSVVVSTEVLAEKFFKLLEAAGLKPKRETQRISEMKKDYLRASLFYHPDRNQGDGANMSELNYLWQSLKGSYFKEQ